MAAIELATNADGPSIRRITASAGVFNAAEVECVEELWNAYLDEGSGSGYAFLVYRDEYG
jgi:hypothetical protein